MTKAGLLSSAPSKSAAQLDLAGLIPIPVLHHPWAIVRINTGLIGRPGVASRIAALAIRMVNALWCPLPSICMTALKDAAFLA